MLRISGQVVVAFSLSLLVAGCVTPSSNAVPSGSSMPQSAMSDPVGNALGALAVLGTIAVAVDGMKDNKSGNSASSSGNVKDSNASAVKVNDSNYAVSKGADVGASGSDGGNDTLGKSSDADKQKDVFKDFMKSGVVREEEIQELKNALDEFLVESGITRTTLDAKIQKLQSSSDSADHAEANLLILNLDLLKELDIQVKSKKMDVESQGVSMSKEEISEIRTGLKLLKTQVLSMRLAVE